MTNQQSLVVLFKSYVIEAYRNEREIYLKSLHPVVERLGINDKLDGEFVSIQSYSEEFGDEHGVLSLTTLEKINILDTNNLVANEKEKRKEITPSQVDFLESTLKKLKEEIDTANANYRSFLSEQGYYLETTGFYGDTEFWYIHPHYHKEWLNDKYNENDYPDWAVIYQGR